MLSIAALERSCLGIFDILIGEAMLTIFACPKPFINPHIATIQRNAITSWTLLHPKPEIILFGHEDGTAEICQQLGLRHIPDVARNEYGTPLLNDLFAKAQRLAIYDLLSYVNADIILISDFIRAIKEIVSWKKECLVVGGRLDMEVNEAWNFEVPDWEEILNTLVKRKGRIMASGTDYFIFSRGLFQAIPPFALARTAWDNWLLWRARRLRVPIVDATTVVTAIHQNHSTASDWKNICCSIEAEHNRQLTNYWAQSFTPRDATHELTALGVRRCLWRSYRQRVNILIDFSENLTRSFRHHTRLDKPTLKSIFNRWR
jgi:hypothetical protein